MEGYQDRPKYQRLVIDFEYGENPDDAYSSIPYEKGANLILHLGEPVGCESYGIDSDLWKIREDRRRIRCIPTIHKGLREYVHRKEYKCRSMERSFVRLLQTNGSGEGKVIGYS